MNTNYNTEPVSDNISTLLDGSFRDALEQKDSDALTQSIEQLKEAEGPVAEWAEGIGTRLQIRDLMVGLKERTAALDTVQDPAILLSVRGYLQDLDKGLKGITGFNTETLDQDDAQALKDRRIGRLADETGHRPDSAIPMLEYFAAQPADATVPASYLADHMREIRNDIVETVWPAAMSAREGNLSIAHKELQAGAAHVNRRLDTALGGVMKWD